MNRFFNSLQRTPLNCLQHLCFSRHLICFHLLSFWVLLSVITLQHLNSTLNALQLIHRRYFNHFHCLPQVILVIAFIFQFVHLNLCKFFQSLNWLFQMNLSPTLWWFQLLSVLSLLPNLHLFFLAVWPQLIMSLTYLAFKLILQFNSVLHLNWYFSLFQ